MNSKPFRVVPFDPALDRSQFTCESEALTTYFRKYLKQDIKRRLTACFVALSREGQIAGYYTLASSSVYLGDLPDHIKKKLPRYPLVPAVRMGRLTVDKTFQGQGLGGAMLADALTRVIRSEIAVYALVVDAKDEDASGFYKYHGFISTKNEPLTLFLPLETARHLLGQ